MQVGPLPSNVYLRQAVIIGRAAATGAISRERASLSLHGLGTILAKLLEGLSAQTPALQPLLRLMRKEPVLAADLLYASSQLHHLVEGAQSRETTPTGDQSIDGDRRNIRYINSLRQSFENCFQQMVLEMEEAIYALRDSDTQRTIESLNRVIHLTRFCTNQTHLLDFDDSTLAPLMRSHLPPLLGLSSPLLCEIDLLGGMKSTWTDDGWENGYERPDWRRLKHRLTEPNLHEAFYDFLRGMGYPIPDHAASIERENRDCPEKKQLIRTLRNFFQNQRSHPEAYAVASRLSLFENTYLSWRRQRLYVVKRLLPEGVVDPRLASHPTKARLDQRFFPYLGIFHQYLPRR